MKKSLKIVLCILGIFILLIGIDIGSILLRNKPILILSDNHSNNNKIYYGLLYDTYNCQEYSMAQIKFKWSNFSCSFKAKTDEIDKDGSEYSIDDLSIRIKEDSLTNKSLILIIKDATGDKYVFGEEFYIEQKKNGEWSRVRDVHDNYGFNAIAYHAYTKDLELKQDWEYMYGSLDKGLYRLVKRVFKASDIPVTEEDHQLISVDFEIK